MKLIQQRKVRSSLTDFSANLSVIGAFDLMEDAVTEFMGDLKIDGLTAKRVYNAVWVFSKTKMKFLKNLAWNNDEFTVVCFFSKISNATINIDVGLKNAKGELCVYSRTEICALDLESGRIRKVSTVGVDESFQTEPPLTDISFDKICADDLPAVEEVKVGFTNIDFVGHTNNKEYVRFILNTYSVREMASSPIGEIEMVYNNQSHENDLLTVRKGSRDGKDVFVIQKGDTTIVKSEIIREAK